MQSLPHATLFFFSMLLNEDIVGVEKPDGICSSTFVVDEFSGLFLHSSVFSINSFTPRGHWCPISLNTCNP